MLRAFKLIIILSLSVLLSGCSFTNVLLLYNNTSQSLVLTYKLNLEKLSNNFLNCNPKIFTPYNRNNLYEKLNEFRSQQSYKNAKIIPTEYSFILKPKSAIVICHGDADVVGEDFAIASLTIQSKSGAINLSGDFLKENFKNTKKTIFEYELLNPKVN